MRNHLLAGFILLLAAPAGAETIAITGATVIDPASNSVRPETTVIVEDGQITSVQPAAKRLPPGVRELDGRGKFLIPGLWDAHAHLSKTGRGSLILYIANGVTGVRDMGSNLEEVRHWREGVRSRTFIGPRIKMSGPMLEASSNVERMESEATVENVDRQRLGVADPDQAKSVVASLANAGVDQIKVRTATDLPTFNAIAKAAAEHGLPLAAHPNGTPDQMLAAGLDSAEHWIDFPPLDKLSQAERAALFGRIAAAGMYVSSTQIVFENITTPYAQANRVLNDAPGHGDPRRKYVCGYVIEDWREQLEEAKDGRFGPVRELSSSLSRDFREMHAAGVPILAGSDAAVLLTYAGFSLHDQLELMVRQMGLSPMDVLRIATTGVSSYFGESERIGSVRAGQAADLVLLDANPLADIANIRTIDAVVAQGQVLDREALDQMLAEVEEDAAGSCEQGSLSGRR